MKVKEHNIKKRLRRVATLVRNEKGKRTKIVIKYNIRIRKIKSRGGYGVCRMSFAIPRPHCFTRHGRKIEVWEVKK
jgi:hypothetical protein